MSDIVATGSSIELIGHAALRITASGKTLLLDPWFFEPIDGNATFHWPPLVRDLDSLVASTDAIWISHIHPDHLDPRTLRRFPAHVPIYIGAYANKGFRDQLRALGRDVREIPFQQEFQLPGTQFRVCLLESDYDESAAYDSAIVVRVPEFTLFNNNDCFLADEKYQWVAEHYQVDYGFLGYSPASYFPICFEFEAAEKQRLLTKNADRRYGDFLKVASLLKPRLSFPFAMGIRFLHPDMLWQNVQFNRAQEAVRRAQAAGLSAETLWPGDRLTGSGEILRRNGTMDEPEEDLALAKYAEQMRTQAERVWETEPPARDGLVEAFRDHILCLWNECGQLFPEVRTCTIAYRLVGRVDAEFSFDFSRPSGEIFALGAPGSFDMRYTYPDKLLQRRLDGEIDWDELHFSNRVSVKQNRYASQFYAMLRHHENSRNQ
jgi:hypothetical protein